MTNHDAATIGQLLNLFAAEEQPEHDLVQDRLNGVSFTIEKVRGPHVGPCPSGETQGINNQCRHQMAVRAWLMDPWWYGENYRMSMSRGSRPTHAGSLTFPMTQDEAGSPFSLFQVRAGTGGFPPRVVNLLSGLLRGGSSSTEVETRSCPWTFTRPRPSPRQHRG